MKETTLRDKGSARWASRLVTVVLVKARERHPFLD